MKDWNSFTHTERLIKEFKYQLKVSTKFREMVDNDWHAVYNDILFDEYKYEFWYEVILKDFFRDK